MSENTKKSEWIYFANLKGKVIKTNNVAIVAMYEKKSYKKLAEMNALRRLAKVK